MLSRADGLVAAGGVADPLCGVAPVCRAGDHPLHPVHSVCGVDGGGAGVRACRLLYVAVEAFADSGRDRAAGDRWPVDQVRLVATSRSAGCDGRGGDYPAVPVPGVVLAPVVGLAGGCVPVRCHSGVRHWEHVGVCRSGHAGAGDRASGEGLRISGVVRDSGGLRSARDVGRHAGNG